MPEKKVSKEQFEILLDFMDKNRELARKCNTCESPEAAQTNKPWAVLATILNSVHNGCKKSSSKWRFYWNDVKFLTRSKYISLQQALAAGQPFQSLTCKEWHILSITGLAPMRDVDHTPSLPVSDPTPKPPDLLKVLRLEESRLAADERRLKAFEMLRSELAGIRVVLEKRRLQTAAQLS